MTELLTFFGLLAGACFLGILFCNDYEDAKDQGYIQTDYEEDEEDES